MRIGAEILVELTMAEGMAASAGLQPRVVDSVMGGQAEMLGFACCGGSVFDRMRAGLSVYTEYPSGIISSGLSPWTKPSLSPQMPPLHPSSRPRSSRSPPL